MGYKLLAVLMILASLSGQAQAQDVLLDSLAAPARDTRPQPTPPDYVAMLFHRLTGKTPDFDAWARATEEYKSAPQTQKTIVMTHQANDWRGAYSLLTPRDAIIIETPVKLSDYSRANEGFFVTSFKNETFFPVHFLDQNYAIVPERIIDKQWIKISSADQVRRIQSASKNGALKMVMFLNPKYADDKTPIDLEGARYWLVSAAVEKMMLYPANEEIALWSSDAAMEDQNSRRQELLRLRP